LFAALNGYIAMRGVNGSTMTALVINVVQLTTLVLFSCLAIYYRLNNPEHATGWAFSGGWDVVMPHPLTGALIQPPIARLVLGGIGFGLMVSIAVTVGLAILGTTLSCLNTAVRVSYAMAQDKEMPELLGAMHGRFATPHRAIWVLVVVSTLIAWVGVYSVVG